MKTFFTLLILPALISCGNKRNENLSVLNASSFNFFKVASGNTIPLSASEGNILYAFGEPRKIHSSTAESNKFPCTTWAYNGATVYLQAGRMVDIDLTSAAYGFLFNGKVIKVGENISTLQSSFPESFSARSSHQILVGLHYNGEPIKGRVLFDFNREERITAISLLN
jgi:hypothetical protein